ncbi:MAG: dethiobiotin synthetase [Candidatus Deianiraeaceae bacterium]|jgi:dethiobiotin synthetase
MQNQHTLEKIHNTFNKVTVVYGINTNCGKTYITQALINIKNIYFKENFAIKPIISGFNATNYQNSDNYKLLQSCGYSNPSLNEVRSISAYILNAALSPDIASWDENISIDFNIIMNFCRDWINKTKGNLFIETAGGVCSPCSNLHTMRSISQELSNYKPYNVLVTTPYIGAISHTISALEMLKFDLLIINKGDREFIKSITNHLSYPIYMTSDEELCIK